jgi:hypothetical protein
MDFWPQPHGDHGLLVAKQRNAVQFFMIGLPPQEPGGRASSSHGGPVARLSAAETWDRDPTTRWSSVVETAFPIVVSTLRDRQVMW